MKMIQRRQMMAWGVLMGTSLGAGAFLISCGKSRSSSSAASVSDWVKTYAEGLAIASPTAPTSSSSLQVQASTETVKPEGTYEEKKAALKELADATSASACKITLPTARGLSQRANCFGPTVNYSNHPDGSGGSGSFPGGDLGIWSSAESDGTACAAAQMNALVGGASSYVDIALGLQTTSICLLKNNGQSMPAVGASVDFTTSLSGAIEAGSQTPTVTSATVTRVDENTFLYAFTGTSDGQKAYSISVKHQAESTDNASYKGRIYGYWTNQNVDAFSVSYKKASDTLNLKMAAGSWMSPVTNSDMFDSNNDLKVGSGWQGNMNQTLMSINTTSGVGQVSHAWQAGSGDDKTRVFNVYTAASGSELSGCGFFGYGNAFSSTLSANTNTINGFICNWAGPGNDHSMSTTASMVQKQCFLRNNSGKFEGVSAKTHITYAPTVSCNDTTAFTYDWPTHSGDNATNDLVNKTTDSDYSSYSAPTAPDLGSGF